MFTLSLLMVFAAVMLVCLVVGVAMIKLLFWLVLLPLRLVWFALTLPFLLLGLAFKLVVGVVLLPVFLFAAVVGAAAVAFALALPLLPLVVLAVFVWAIVKLAARPAVAVR